MSELRDLLAKAQADLSEAHEYLSVDELRSRLPQLEVEMCRPDLWDDAERAKKTQTEFSMVSDDLKTYDGLSERVDDSEALIELYEESQESELDVEARSALESLASEFTKLELRSLFDTEYDVGDAICEIHSGAGGTDSQDWAEMMLNMYERWAKDNDFTFELRDVQKGSEAGISSAEFIVRGRHAYGYLQSERGVHRIVRISPFDSAARRHTSFSSFGVIPYIEDAISQVEIVDSEIRVDTYRASGAGGQHINKTDSAVRITHQPTGIVVSCQNQRSQHQNKEVCMEMLAVRLLAKKREEQAAELAAEAGESKKVEWGSQIRSYVLAPYQLVKDERTAHQSPSPDEVLGGGLTPFMEAWLRWRRSTETGS